MESGAALTSTWEGCAGVVHQQVSRTLPRLDRVEPGLISVSKDARIRRPQKPGEARDSTDSSFRCMVDIGRPFWPIYSFWWGYEPRAKRTVSRIQAFAGNIGRWHCSWQEAGALRTGKPIP